MEISEWKRISIDTRPDAWVFPSEKVVADQLGHTLDVNQNVYTQVPMELRVEAVNELEAALVSQ